MEGPDLLIDAFGRIRTRVHDVVDGMTPADLAFRIDGDANSIAWLVWHLTRVQDDHVCEAAQIEQAWIAGGWEREFGLPFSSSATGYGHGPQDVGAVQVASPELLTGYHDAVHEQTVRYLRGLAAADFDRIVDESWDPPVSLGVRLVSVIDDDLEHVGQAAFVRGVLQRGGGS
jgi:Protein of unknown function (DUF664)